MITSLTLALIGLVGWLGQPEVGWAAMCIAAGMVIGTVFGVLTLIQWGWTRPARSTSRHRAGKGKPATVAPRPAQLPQAEAATEVFAAASMRTGRPLVRSSR